MSIRHQLEWDEKKFHGYVDFGVKIHDGNELTKEAFVLLIVCINGTWIFFNNWLKWRAKSQTYKILKETNSQIFKNIQ